MAQVISALYFIFVFIYLYLFFTFLWFCFLSRVLLLRGWTINPSRLLSLPESPIPQILLPFPEQPCLELRFSSCCGSGDVPGRALQAAGWVRPSWSASPSSPNLVVEVLSFTPDVWYTELFLAGRSHGKTLITAPDNHRGAINSLLLTLL